MFATPSGERHELGLLMATLVALGAGADPLYLGVELPVEDLLTVVAQRDAPVLALGIVSLPADALARIVRALRGGLPDRTLLWLGGAGAREIELDAGVEYMETLDALEQRVALLGLENRRG